MQRPNRLISESSPYLRQHAHNPVDWYPWGDEAFERAQREARPVLLSVGYSSCHWCHVMERESFDDPKVASLMNDLFVNVKVDREERPDVDEIYMRAVQLLTGRGGWPMTVFLTPEREPFHAGTYFPPVDRHGLPAFSRVLQAVAAAYRDRRADIDRTVEQLRRGIVDLDAVEQVDDTAIDRSLPQRTADALLDHVDDVYGGLGRAPKFPNTAAFQLLLRRARREGRDALREAALHTCTRMAEGGIYDQIGGGFHRYSVDQRWHVPHFEKMLYDNAQIPRLYLEAFQISGEGRLRAVVEETLDYVLREMRDPGGGFYSATDADSEGEEGRFFVWTPAEVARVVAPEDVDLVCRFWDISAQGNFEGRSIARVTIPREQLAAHFGRTSADAERAIERARTQLYAARLERVPPLRDEKVLSSWNGLMLGTLAEAGRVLSCSRFVEAARDAATFIWSHMRQDGRLLHCWHAGTAKIPAFLDDHVFVAAGLVDLHLASGACEYLDQALELVDDIDSHFHDEGGGGYFFTPNDGEPLLTRTKAGADGSLPSGNGAAAMLLLRLHALTGEAAYRRRAEEILRLFHDSAVRNPFAAMSYLEALEAWTEGMVEIVVTGPDGPERRALLEVANAAYLPHALIIAVDGTAERVPWPARERAVVNGRPTAYVCRAFTCSPPVSDPEELRRMLADAGS